MPIKERDFNFWIEQNGYVPTARLHSWPKEWYRTKNLRFFGSVNWIAAVPHDIESRVRLEALYDSIRKRQFFDPFFYENKVSPDSARRSIYVSLLPRPVVDWFSKHTLEEIHDQIAMYIALFEMEEKYRNPNVMGDTHASYHSAIQQHLSNFWKKYPSLNKAELPLGPHDLFEKENRMTLDGSAIFQRETELEEAWRRDKPNEAQSYDEKWNGFWDAETSLLEEVYNSGKLPPWFIKKIEWKSSDEKIQTYLSLQKLRHDENLGWQRPTGALADDFGIVSYGLTYHDELRLQEKKIEYNNQTGEEIIKKLTSKEFDDVRNGTLSNIEHDSTAFEFLMYARSKGEEWANWTISTAKYTGYIYVYSDGHAFKIGFSHDHPDQRKPALQTGNSHELELVGYIEGTREKEKILHKKFEHKKTVGEWFDLSADDIKAILSRGH